MLFVILGKLNPESVRRCTPRESIWGEAWKRFVEER